MSDAPILELDDLRVQFATRGGMCARSTGSVSRSLR